MLVVDCSVKYKHCKCGSVFTHNFSFWITLLHFEQVEFSVFGVVSKPILKVWEGIFETRFKYTICTDLFWYTREHTFTLAFN